MRQSSNSCGRWWLLLAVAALPSAAVADDRRDALRQAIQEARPRGGMAGATMAPDTPAVAPPAAPPAAAAPLRDSSPVRSDSFTASPPPPRLPETPIYTPPPVRTLPSLRPSAPLVEEAPRRSAPVVRELPEPRPSPAPTPSTEPSRAVPTPAQETPAAGTPGEIHVESGRVRIRRDAPVPPDDGSAGGTPPGGERPEPQKQEWTRTRTWTPADEQGRIDTVTTTTRIVRRTVSGDSGGSTTVTTIRRDRDIRLNPPAPEPPPPQPPPPVPPPFLPPPPVLWVPWYFPTTTIVTQSLYYPYPVYPSAGSYGGFGVAGSSWPDYRRDSASYDYYSYSGAYSGPYAGGGYGEVAGAAAALRPEPAEASPPDAAVEDADGRRLRVCTGKAVGTHVTVGESLGLGVAEVEELELVTTAGSWENLRALQQGRCDVATAHRDAVEAFLQQKGPEAGARRPLRRAIRGWYSDYVQLLCGREAAPRALADLSEGRLLLVGGPGSAAAVTWDRIVAANPAYGAVLTRSSGTEQALDAVAEGDATCLLLAAGLDGTVPELAGQYRDRLRLLPVVDLLLDDLRDGEGGPLYVPVVIAGNGYVGFNDDGARAEVPTLAVPVDVMVGSDWADANPRLYQRLVAAGLRLRGKVAGQLEE